MKSRKDISFLSFSQIPAKLFRMLTLISSSDKACLPDCVPMLGLCVLSLDVGSTHAHQPFFPQDDRQTYSINVSKTKNIF